MAWGTSATPGRELGKQRVFSGARKHQRVCSGSSAPPARSSGARVPMPPEVRQGPQYQTPKAPTPLQPSNSAYDTQRQSSIMSTPALKLTYFDIKGRGHSARLAMEIGGIAYEDDKVQFSDWPKLKESQVYAHLPVLTVDGTKTLAENNAILKYVGSMAGLYPTDQWDALLVDETNYALEELTTITFSKPLITPDDAAAHSAKLVSEVLPAKLALLEKRLKSIGTTKGRAVGSDMTIADVKLYQINEGYEQGLLSAVPKNFISAELYPTLYAIIEEVGKHPAVVAYNSRAAQ